MDLTYSLSAVMEIFFRGAMAGYAGGGQYRPDLDEPGRKIFRHDMGDLVYIDAYRSTGKKSAGEKTIYLRRDSEWIALWAMQYRGEEFTDDRAVIMFLKSTLLLTYQLRQFMGGRGPLEKTSGDRRLCYRNHLFGEFTCFSGQEIICDNDPRELEKEKSDNLCLHEYSGLSLVDLV